MKTTKFFLVIFALLVSIGKLSAQPISISEMTIPSTSPDWFNSSLILNDKVFLSYQGNNPSYYFDGSSWKIDYYTVVGELSGVKKSNGELVVYHCNDIGLNKWDNATEKWVSIAGPPSVENYSPIFVKDEFNVYFVYGSKLWHYNGGRNGLDTFSLNKQLPLDAGDYFDEAMFADNEDVLFTSNGDLFRYNIALDSVFTIYTSPVEISMIFDISSVDGVNIFFLSNGNVCRWNKISGIVDVVFAGVNSSEYGNTFSLVSNNLMFIAGTKGIKKIVVNNEGIASSEVVYAISNPYHKIKTSSVDGENVIFAGKIVDESGMNQLCVKINCPLGTIESTIPNINVYPNPTSGLLKIDGLTEISDIQIFDIAGKLIFQQQYQENETINISELNSGMYIVNVRNSQGVFSSKIIKQ